MQRKNFKKTTEKKVRIFLLTVCMVMALIFNLFAVILLGSGAQAAETVLNINALEITEPWNGSVAVSFTGGKGSLEEPYQISNGAELAFLASIVNNDVTDGANGGEYRDSSKYYVLTNDIYLNDTADWKNWGTENPENTALNKWMPIGKGGVDFEADFDGCGFAVYGIYISAGSDNIGLFGSIDGGSIRNLGVEQSYIKGGSTVGGIAGWLKNGSITNCYNSGTVSGEYSGVSGGDNIGGIAGHANIGSVIANCYNTGDISGEYSVGGIAGYLNSKTKNSFIRNCYSAGKVICGNSAKQAGYIAGFVSSDCEVSYSYYFKDINYDLSGMSGKSPGAILNVSVFNQIGALDSPVVIDGVQFSGLTAALNAYVSYENDNPDNYALWHGKPFPNFNERTPAPGYIPTELTAVYKSKLSAVDLTGFNDDSGQWKWETPSSDVGATGINNFEAIYMPNNTADYDIINLQLPVTVNPKPLTDELKPVLDKFTYSGSPHTPLPTVEDLELNVDYIVTYSDNVNPGTATLTIIGIGNYSGELSVNFMIVKANGWIWYVIIFSVVTLCAAGALTVVLVIKRKRLSLAATGEASTSKKDPSLTLGEVDAVRDLLRDKQNQAGSSFQELPKSMTLREREVAELLLSGKKSKEIAAELFISNTTVKKHIQSILRKSGCKDQLNFVIKYGGGRQ